jgi:dTDP-4-dehydrorhamnose 3,5-epimerase-like enzyme
MYWVELSTHQDDRGALVPIESKGLFEFKRIYFIYGEVGVVRGGHRHKRSIQMLYCVSGGLKIRIVKRGKEEFFTLCARGSAMVLEPEDWHELLQFEKGTVVAVIASELYDPDDYILKPVE